ncbi:MAG: amino acid ABC transporter permease [Clostridia bacterium]|nr:amino acid ABC transporter permease [Clostridia bacterium]
MDFAGKFQVFWELFIEQGAWKRVLSVGLVNTLLIAVLGLLIGIVLGTLIGAVKVMPKYKLLPRILDKICSAYVGFFRGTPLVVQLLLTYYVLWPLMNVSVSSLYTAIIVFGLNSAAYVSEIMRGGLLSVDSGQMEAGRALGLSYGSTMMQIIIPQAIKNILPTLGNEFIALIKDTSVVSFVAAVDLYKTFTEIGNVRYEYFMPYIAMALVYMVLVALITLGVKLMERSLRKSDRNSQSL